MAQTDYAVAPGEYLAEWLEDTGTTQQQAANRIGSSRKLINEIVNGRAPITDDTAVKLGRLTGIPADSWMKFEALYRLDLARLRDEADLAQHASKIPAHTAAFLRTLGATRATMRAPGKLVADFLSFHHFGTWAAFEDSIESNFRGEYSLAALKENKTDFDRIACATWLRAGEMSDAHDGAARFVFEPERLRAALPALRERAARADASLLRDLSEMLADFGVVFTMVDPPQGLPLHGMTRWIDQRVPVIQQTGRRGKDGFIIWAFFHELGHVLNDPRGEVHYEFTSEKARNSRAETAANQFAFDVLFGEAGLRPFDGLTSDRDIARVARDVGITPGVAVHHLHRKRKLPYQYGNRLFVTLDWDA